MKLFKKVFTIAEMLICLAIIAMVVAMVIPAAMSKKPNRNKAMFRKAYYNLERAVSELVNDESIYPSTKSSDFGAGHDRSTLFAYFIPDADYDETRDDHKIEIKGLTGLQQRKQDYTGEYFCSQIASKLNTSGKVHCDVMRSMPADGTAIVEDTEAGDGFRPNFITNDGVAWFINPMPHFCYREVTSSGDVIYRGQDTESTCKHELKTNGDLKIPAAGTNNPGSDFLCFQIDINGNEKPNRRIPISQDDATDRFEVCVYYDGKIQVPAKDNGKEAEYLKSNSIID